MIGEEQEPTIWVTHDRGNCDYGSAKRFGKLRAVFDKSFNPFDIRGAYRLVSDLVDTASSENDWIIVVGSGIAASLFTHAYARKWGKLPLLVFQAKQSEYVKKELITNTAPLS